MTDINTFNQCQYNTQPIHHLLHSTPYNRISAHNNTHTFFSIGDWGEHNTDQYNVAQQMSLYSEIYKPLFIISTGDNFYRDGVDSVDDPQWTTTYENIYTTQSLQCNWYSVLGNHDYHMEHYMNEINYSIEQCDHRWIMPAQYYYKQLQLYSDVILDIFFLDTWLLCDDTYSNGTIIDQSIKQQHVDWLVNQLELSHHNSLVHWRIVVGHYPLLSGGEHGNTNELIDSIQSILYKYNIDFYLCGHDHTLQHLADQHNFNYYISGNGAKRGTYHAIDESIYGIVDPGFMLHQINTTHMYTQFIDLNGIVVYHTVQQSRQSQITELLPD